jgi:hypothetical protein
MQWQKDKEQGRQTMSDRKLHRKLRIEQHGLNLNRS